MKTFFYCLTLFIFTRLWFFVLAIFVNYYGHYGFHLQNLFTQLDGKWYLDIVQHGYDVTPKPWTQGHANYVFFPVYPLLIKTLVLLTPLSPIIAGQIIANLFFLLSLCLLHRLLNDTVSISAARWGVTLLAFSPFNVYFLSIYTESLLLALTLGCWLAANYRAWWLVGLLGCVMSASHPNGILIFIFAVWFVVSDYRQHRDGVLQYLPILLIPFGLIGYMAYLHQHIGDALGFLHDEKYWSHRTGWQFQGFWQEFITRIQKESYSFGVYILGLLLSLYLACKRFYKEALLIPIMTFAGILTGSFSSQGRYTATEFSFYFALALLFGGLKLKKGDLLEMGFLVTLVLIAAQILVMNLYLAQSYWVY